MLKKGPIHISPANWFINPMCAPDSLWICLFSHSKKCRIHKKGGVYKPPPLLLKKVLQHTSNLYCNTRPICIAVLSVPLSSQERGILQYFSHCKCICIAVQLPFVLQYASHLDRNAFGKSLVVVVTRMFPRFVGEGRNTKKNLKSLPQEFQGNF